VPEPPWGFNCVWAAANTFRNAASNCSFQSNPSYTEWIKFASRIKKSTARLQVISLFGRAKLCNTANKEIMLLVYVWLIKRTLADQDSARVGRGEEARERALRKYDVSIKNEQRSKDDNAADSDR
jgi:hypothetical protein